MLICKHRAEKFALLLIIFGVLVSMAAGSLMVFAQESGAEALPEEENRQMLANLEAISATVAAPTLELLTDKATLEAVVQKSLQDTLGVAGDAFADTGVMQDLADKKEAEKKAKEEAAKKKKEEEARKKAEAAKKKEAAILATAQKYIDASGVKVSASDLVWMARTIYFEANVEPYAGKVAVANVILNRVEADFADGTIYGVIFQKNAFSVTRNSKFKTFAPNDSCYRAAIEALQGRNEVGDCLWFVSTSVKDCWAIRNANLYKTIGTHKFFNK